MEQTTPVGQANWRVAALETTHPKDAFYLGGLGLLIGFVAGLIISIFRVCKDSAYQFMLDWTHLHDHSFWHICWWFFLAFLAAAIVGWLIRNPAIRYGGADWIGTTLQDGQKNPWRKILFPKFLGSWLVLACGVSVGSEGPCIQMGAATAVGLKEFDAKQSIERRYFILAGCAAGLAAAFSAPFAGICYVYEIMNEKLSRPLFVFLMAGAIGVYLACTQVFGLGTLLPLEQAGLPQFTNFWILVPIGIFAGLVGIAYNYGLRYAIKLYTNQKLIPAQWLPLLPFMAAALLVYFVPTITGEGMTVLPEVMQQQPFVGYLCLFIVAKLIFTAFCYGSGIPAGVMVPVLCLGGVAGAVYADWAISLGLMAPMYAHSCLAMGMAGAFAAAERAPLTGLVLVLEVTGAYATAPGMLLVAAVATVCARICKVEVL